MKLSILLIAATLASGCALDDNDVTYIACNDEMARYTEKYGTPEEEGWIFFADDSSVTILNWSDGTNSAFLSVGGVCQTEDETYWSTP